MKPNVEDMEKQLREEMLELEALDKSEATDDLATLRNRAREMRRNNPYWNAALTAEQLRRGKHFIRNYAILQLPQLATRRQQKM